MNIPNFPVKVYCMTFNHSNYITDAMEGFCMQRTEFPFVCVIVDDASTDGEQEVIRKYIEENFDLTGEESAVSKETEDTFATFSRHKTNKNCYFAVYYLKENHYSKRRPKNTYMEEYGKDCKYVAVCEGDDYWTDPLKLQKQVDFLEQNPNTSMVCARTKLFSEKKQKYIGENRCLSHSGYLNKNDVILKGGEYISTASIVYRAQVRDNYPSYCKKCYIGDYPLQIMCAMKGDIYYFDDAMAVYRMENSSSWCGNAAKGVKEFNLYKYHQKETLQKMFLGFAKDYPSYEDSFEQRLCYSINSEITRKTPKRIAKQIVAFYKEYIDLFPLCWKLDLLIRLHTPRQALGFYTKMMSKSFYRRFSNK